jgi:hypothetical protein
VIASVLAVAATLLAAPPGEAPAAPTVVRLVYLTGAGAAAECPAATELEAQVSARLGGSPFSEVVGTLLVVVIERQSPGYLGRMFVRAAGGAVSGERQVRMTSCPRLVRSLAVAAAVLLGAPAVDPGSSAAGDPPAPQPPVPAPAPLPGESSPVLPPPGGAVPSPAADPLPAPPVLLAASPAPPRWLADSRWQISLAPILALGSGDRALKGPAFGGALAGALVWPRLALGAELRVMVPQAEPAGRGQVSTGTVVAVALACRARSGASGCAALTAGAVHAAGEGFDRNYTFLRPYVGLGGRVGYQIGGHRPARRFQLRPYVWFEFPITRWTFTVDGNDVVRRSILSVGLGLETVLWLR